MIRTEREAHAALARPESDRDTRDLLDYLLATVEEERELVERVRRERRDHKPLDSVDKY